MTNATRPTIYSLLEDIRSYLDRRLAGSEVRQLERDTDFQLSKDRASNIEGWLVDIEGALLYAMAKKCTGKGVVVEIGSGKGKSTTLLAHGSKAGNGGRLCHRPYLGNAEGQRLEVTSTFDDFKRNIARAKADDLTIPIVKTSEEAASTFFEPCELIFIDGCHEFDFVTQDFVLWYPKLIEGGSMPFHDTLDGPGPRTLVKNSLYNSKNFKNVRFVRNITYGEKVGRNTVVDRLKNRYYLLLNTLYKFLQDAASH